MGYKLRHEGNEAQKLGGRVNRSMIEPGGAKLFVLEEGN